MTPGRVHFRGTSPGTAASKEEWTTAMPLVEFECSACSRRFEDLVRGGEKPACPSCGGTRLRRMLSTFGVGAPSASGSSGSPGACGSCGDPRGPGACGLD